MSFPKRNDCLVRIIAMEAFSSISEIVPEPAARSAAQPPLREWDLTVLERGLCADLGDVGGRRDFVANARVLVTEEDGTCWTGLTILG